SAVIVRVRDHKILACGCKVCGLISVQGVERQVGWSKGETNTGRSYGVIAAGDELERIVAVTVGGTNTRLRSTESHRDAGQRSTIFRYLSANDRELRITG